MTEQVKVTQADREAASKVLRAEWDMDDAIPVLEGQFDRHGIVQAFARHAIAAQAELLEALELFLDACDIAEDGPDESDLKLANKRLAEAKMKAREIIAKAKGEA